MQIFAKSFVYSLDTISKQLGKLSQISGNKGERIALCELYSKEFMDLKYIRDSSMHIEDRGLGLDRKLKQIKTQVLVIGGFINNCYSYSGSDGKNYQIEISTKIARKAGNIIQNIINTYVWEQ